MGASGKPGAVQIDAALFSNAAASGTAPAGLLNGVTATTATSGGGDEAMIADIANLASAVAPVAGDRIMIVAAPKQAVKLRLRARQPLGYDVLASSALADGTVVAVAVNAIASAYEDTPEFDISTWAAIHVDDEPTAISTPGSPATVAAPVRSTFQTDCIALRMRLGVTWAKRAAGSVAFITGASW